MTSKPQLRGQKLLDAIQLSLEQLSNANERYTYNASELARRVGCSRPTLDNKAEFIDSVLDRIGADRRLKREHPLLEHLHTRIELLEEKNKVLKNELNVLRGHHAEIYSTLLLHSVDAATLIKPVVEMESIGKGVCIFCGGSVTEDHKFPDKNVVVKLSDHRPKND